MVLAEDVKDRSGRLLIPRGTALVEKHLKIIKMWGVVEAEVKDTDSRMINASAMKTFDESTLAAASEVVRKRFCHADADHPAIRELISLSVQRTASGRIIDQDTFRERYWFGEEIEDYGAKKTAPYRAGELFPQGSETFDAPGGVSADTEYDFPAQQLRL